MHTWRRLFLDLLRAATAKPLSTAATEAALLDLFSVLLSKRHLPLQAPKPRFDLHLLACIELLFGTELTFVFFKKRAFVNRDSCNLNIFLILIRCIQEYGKVFYLLVVPTGGFYVSCGFITTTCRNYSVQNAVKRQVLKLTSGNKRPFIFIIHLIEIQIWQQLQFVLH